LRSRSFLSGDHRKGGKEWVSRGKTKKVHCSFQREEEKEKGGKQSLVLPRRDRREERKQTVDIYPNLYIHQGADKAWHEEGTGPLNAAEDGRRERNIITRGPVNCEV